MSPDICLRISLFIVSGLLPVLALGATIDTITTAPSTTSRTSRAFPTGTAYSLAMQMCWSRGSICSVAMALGEEECDVVEDAHGLDKYWECVCTSGLGAVKVACDYCEESYGIGRLAVNTTSSCLDRGFTLAPIPSSVLSQQSRHNATRATVPTTPTPTHIVTIQATQPDLPTVATTAALPLETGAASRRSAWDSYGLLLAGSVVAGLVLAL
ncbi:hypothetical protein VTH06DRAFT_912 [Thermothelomyces fergusii]